MVIDAATGAPLSRVLVADITQGDSGPSAVTAVDGRFDLTLPPGACRLRASVVGYSLVERDVTLAAGVTLDLTIPLVGGTGYTEAVTVSAERFRHADPGAPAQQVLGSADIQNLRGVLTDDPLRAVQVLPGVATGDDLRSEFTVRGSNFSHMHLTLNGFTTPYLLHAIRAVEDESSSGSVAMINSDILQDVALVSGGYVQRSGNRTGAIGRVQRPLGIARGPASAHRGQRNGSVARGRRAAAWQARIVAGLRASELSRSRHRPAGRRSGAVWVLRRADEVRLRLRYYDTVSQETYWGDLDQRHTFNLLARTGCRRARASAAS